MGTMGVSEEKVAVTVADLVVDLVGVATVVVSVGDLEVAMVVAVTAVGTVEEPEAERGVG